MDLDELRHTIAVGCRILGARGLSEDILGHISARFDEHHEMFRQAVRAFVQKEVEPHVEAW